MNEVKDYMNKHITTMVKGLLDKTTIYFQIGGSEDFGRFDKEVTQYIRDAHRAGMAMTAHGDEQIEKRALDMARKGALANVKQAIKDGHWLSIRTEIGQFDKDVYVVDELNRVVIFIGI